jgi:K+-transporting ATPase ATPase C chain
MKRDIVTSVIGIVVLTILLGLVYPLVITGVSQVAFPGNANGQKIYVNGEARRLEDHRPELQEAGDRKERQARGRRRRNRHRSGPAYFQSRPSATEGGAYNAAASTFSNRGPNDKITEEADAENIKEYLELNKPYDPR